MYTEEFNYYLPDEHIAQYPERERSSSRLLIFNRREGIIEHRFFEHLPEYLRKGDVLVLNKSKVFPARLEARKETGGNVHILLVEETGTNQWRCLVRGVKRNVAELKVTIGDARALLSRIDGSWFIHFISDDAYKVLNVYGKVPLPPYIKRKGDNEHIDMDRYQTVYAEDVGSIAAPTAGFHFTKELLERIEGMGIYIVKVVLHIGMGTFLLVKKERIEDHEMADEYYYMTAEAKELIDRAKREGRRVIACGTSVVRTLETVFSGNGTTPLQGRTALFIYPGYQFRVVDALITNFHLPKSPPLLLTAAFAGKDALFRCYREAQEKGYRFYSYGDGMFIY